MKSCASSPASGSVAPPGRRSGFTLIELVVVILILGILASVTVPSLQGISPKYRLRSAARLLGSNIHLVRNYAAGTSKEYGLRYDLENQRYWIVLPPGKDDDPDLAFDERETLGTMELPEYIVIESIILPDGTSEQSGLVDIIFDAFGHEGSHLVYLRNEEGALSCVKFNALLGLVDYSSEEEQFAQF